MTTGEFMRVAILGGGFQGCCVALALARRGVDVVVYDRHSTLLEGAATANEGKIHLGYVYASDRSLATARTMLCGALCFAPLMRCYLESDAPLVASAPFIYGVHRDSQVNTEDFGAHLAATHDLIAASPNSEDYFGMNLATPPQRLTRSQLEISFNPSFIRAAFDTPEVAIDSVALAGAMRHRMAQDPRIELRMCRTVTAVDGEDSKMIVRSHGEAPDEADKEPFACVVNALWDGRLAVDATRNIHPRRPWMHRFKHGIRFGLSDAATLPSVTLVLGPFGDVVSYGNGQFYISWYPACRTAHSDATAPPAWRTEPEEPLRAEIIRESFAAMGDNVPALLSACPQEIKVKAGVIVAWGHTDIDDRASELHSRHDIGVHSYGSYHSIDPGKLTMVPYFAELCVKRILAAPKSWQSL